MSESGLLSSIETSIAEYITKRKKATTAEELQECKKSLLAIRGQLSDVKTKTTTKIANIHSKGKKRVGPNINVKSLIQKIDGSLLGGLDTDIRSAAPTTQRTRTPNVPLNMGGGQKEIEDSLLVKQASDDEKHSDNANPTHRTASLYDMIEAAGGSAKPIGEFNTSKIVFNKNHGEHWLNGIKVVEYDIDSAEFEEQFKKANTIHMKILQNIKSHISFYRIMEMTAGIRI